MDTENITWTANNDSEPSDVDRATFTNYYVPDTPGDDTTTTTTPEPTPEPTPTPEFDLPDVPTPLSDLPDAIIEEPAVPLADTPEEYIFDDQVPLGDAPQTGDSSHAFAFLGLMMAALAGLLVTRRKFN